MCASVFNLAAVQRKLTGPAVQTVLWWLHHLTALCPSVIFLGCLRTYFSSTIPFSSPIKPPPRVTFSMQKRLIVIFSMQCYQRLPFGSWTFLWCESSPMAVSLLLWHVLLVCKCYTKSYFRKRYFLLSFLILFFNIKRSGELRLEIWVITRYYPAELAQVVGFSKFLMVLKRGNKSHGIP